MHWVQWVFLGWITFALIVVFVGHPETRGILGWFFAITIGFAVISQFYPQDTGQTNSRGSGWANKCNSGSWWDADAGPLGNGRHRNSDGKFCKK